MKCSQCGKTIYSCTTVNGLIVCDWCKPRQPSPDVCDDCGLEKDAHSIVNHAFIPKPPFTSERDKAAEAYADAQGFPRKYDDNATASGRIQYGTLMRYEIRDYVADAWLAGHARASEEIAALKTAHELLYKERTKSALLTQQLTASQAREEGLRRALSNISKLIVRPISMADAESMLATIEKMADVALAAHGGGVK